MKIVSFKNNTTEAHVLLSILNQVTRCQYVSLLVILLLSLGISGAY